MENGQLISEKALKQACGRFGRPSVVEALAEIEEIQRRHRQRTPSGILSALAESYRLYRDSSARKAYQVAQVLFQDSPETEDRLQRLVAKVNGVSEPATVPHQTPEARVTPGAVDVSETK